MKTLAAVLSVFCLTVLASFASRGAVEAGTAPPGPETVDLASAFRARVDEPAAARLGMHRFSGDPDAGRIAFESNWEGDESSAWSPVGQAQSECPSGLSIDSVSATPSKTRAGSGALGFKFWDIPTPPLPWPLTPTVSPAGSAAPPTPSRT